MRKTVIITGVSSGIGLATAEYFRDAGWCVIGTVRNISRDREKLEALGISVEFMDLMKPDSIQSAAERILMRTGKVDVVINNAGLCIMGPLEVLGSEAIDNLWRTNFMGSLGVMKAFLPHFRLQRSGTFVNISSLGGRIAFPLASVYHASKYALEGLTESMQYELQSLGIRVKLVEPGGVRTDLLQRPSSFADASLWKEYDEKQENYQKFIQGANSKASDPKITAQVIYKAATDSSMRLRYISGSDARIFLCLRKILPDIFFRRLLTAIYNNFAIRSKGMGR